MRTSAPIDLSFRSVGLIPSEHLSPSPPPPPPPALGDEMHKAARANAHSAAERPAGREKGRE